MKLFSGMLIGLLSGLLLYLSLGTFFSMVNRSATTGNFEAWKAQVEWNIVLFFIGGGVLSTILVVRGAQTTATVWARGGLLGAAEWLGVGLLMAVWSFWWAADQTVSDTGSAGAAGLIAGFFSMAGLVAAFIMALASLTVYFIASRSREEFASQPERTPCPECGESISIQARKCRYCGAVSGA